MLFSVKRDAAGQVICPVCGSHYTPQLEARTSPGFLEAVRFTGLKLQEAFPDVPSIWREQLISGICSDDCWDNFLGPEN